MYRLIRLSLLVAVVGSGGTGCGTDGEPGPGYADPCDTAMGPALGCPPAAPVSASSVTITDACHHLVSCGILAGEFLGNVSGECSISADCKGGQCLTTSNGDRCHYPYLDYQWCVGKFSGAEASVCGDTQEFTAGQVSSIIQCITTTPCASLGLQFWQKRISTDDRPELDKITCPDGKANWTATVCDYGLLRY